VRKAQEVEGIGLALTFQNRYKSILVEEEPYFLELLRYLHLNPVRARLVKTLRKLDAYPWSGHAVLLGNREAAWQDVGYVLEQFSADETRARRAYRPLYPSPNALMPAIESTAERDLMPDQLLADSLYGSDDNCNAAEEKGVELVAPTMGQTNKKETGLSDFEFSQDGEVTACPEGHAPSKIKTKGERHTARFDKKHCESCPHRDSCPVKPGKKGWYYLVQ